MSRGFLEVRAGVGLAPTQRALDAYRDELRGD